VIPIKIDEYALKSLVNISFLTIYGLSL